MLSYELANIIGTCGDGAAVFSAGVLYRNVGSHVKATRIVSGETVVYSCERIGRIIKLDVSRCNYLLLVAAENALTLFDVQKQVPVKHITCKREIRTVRFSPSTKYIALGFDASVELWNLNSLEKEGLRLELQSRHAIGSANRFAWSCDDAWFGVTSTDGVCRLINNSKKYISNTATIDGRSLAIHVSNNGGSGELKIFSADSSIMLCCTNGCARVCRINVSEGSNILCADFNDDASTLCVGTSTGSFGLYDCKGGNLIVETSLSLPSSKPNCTFDPCGELVMLDCRMPNQMCLWDWKANGIVYEQYDELIDMTMANFSLNGNMLIAGSSSGLVKVWSVSDSSCVASFAEHKGQIMDVICSSRDDVFITASLDGTARAYDLNKFKNFRTLTSPNGDGLVRLAVDSSDDIVCGATENGHNILVWSMLSGQLLDILVGHEAPIVSLQVCKMSTRVVSCSWDKTARMWDVQNSKKQVESYTHSSELISASLSSNGKLLATATRNGHINIWHVQDGSTYRSFDFNVAALSISSCSSLLHFMYNDSILVALDSNHTLGLYDVSTASLIKRVELITCEDEDGVTKTHQVRSICCEKDGLLLGILGPNTARIYSGRSIAANPSMIYENVSESSVHLAVVQGRYAAALEASVLLDSLNLFNAVLDMLPQKHAAEFACSLKTSSLKHLFLSLIKAVSSSRHVENILILLRELCRRQPKTLLVTKPVVKMLSSRLHSLQRSTASAAENNHAMVDFICSR